MAEIKLSGGEISLLKTLGFSGVQMNGSVLLERAEDMESAEFLETLDGLLSLDYVLSNKTNVCKVEEVENSFFRVNPAHARELRQAVHPGGRREKEQRGRRQRRG